MTITSTFNAYSIRVAAPNGTMFIVINEKENKPAFVQIYLGKTGSNLFAYTNAIADLISNMLSSGSSIDDVIQSISNTTADKIVYNGPVQIRSDVDAIVYGLMKYKATKYEETFGKQRRILY